MGIRMRENRDTDTGSFKKIWDVLSPLVYYYLVYSLAYIVLAFIAKAVSGAGVPDKIKSGDGAAASFLSLLNAAAVILGVLPLLPMLKAQLHRERVFSADKNGKTWKYLITIVIAFTSSLGLNIILILSGLTASSETYNQVAEKQYGTAFGLGLALYGIVSPLAEEIVFRGLVYNRLKKYFNVLISGIASALIFGAWHANLVQALYGSLMGLLLAYMYEYFEDFKIPCLFHAAANILVYSVTYNDRLYETAVSWHNAAALLLIMAAVLVWLERRRRKKLS